ncbi:FAD-binding domain-containing protein [Sulfitobacter sp. HNIBRBA3233]|uniref:FAD-binding domain-containing protein n=1 Tax=Sulfitobacter marinivivus TaxID=3158558 RepID=UPI0032DFDCDA
MKHALDLFPPSRDAAHSRLDSFAPQAGLPYARRRNTDFGPERQQAVSTLSPYLRMKVLDESAVSRAVLSQTSAQEAEKFLMELWWRTYWKGWLEQRPGVWSDYREALERLSNEIQTQSGLRQRWEAACLGETGIAPFDHWAQELATTGYLHNHARMWFASIWIFTLGLPWQLGADFFLRHLLDGDAAVNTLSWRWVAGIQTRGKTYLARPENIEKFTDGRFANVTGLATEAPAVDAPPPPDRQPIPEMPDYAGAPGDRVGLLVHGDDLGAPFLDDLGIAPQSIAYIDATATQSPWQTAPHVTEFRSRLAADMWPGITGLEDAQAVVKWAGEARLDRIVTPHAPVGPTRALLRRLRKTDGIPAIDEVRRAVDSTAWPLATKGFFKFKEHIPDLLDQFAR